MDELLNILFSIGFVLIGSLAFHISALVSGHDIYRDLPTHESTLLSIVAGIVIFLFSPINFIIFTNTTTCYANILADILKFEVLFAFFGCAFGLGLIFGCVTILKARVNILKWFRYQSGMRFWISYYGFAWDDFLKSVKQDGEVFVQTDNKMFKGLLDSYSTKNEPRELVIVKPKIKINGREEEIEGEENARLLITGSEIKGIIVPERSFRKHYESMGHISQAFYYQILAIGFFFLSCSAYLTGLQLGSLKSFYYVLSLFFLVLTIVVLCVSVWVAQKDFDNWASFSKLSSDIIFMGIFLLSLPILLILLIMHISLILILIFVFLYIFLLPFLYIYIISKWWKKPINGCFDKIKGDFKDNRKLLEDVIQEFYLQLSCNEKEKIENIKNKILKKYENDGNKQEKINKMIIDLKQLKDEGKCGDKNPTINVKYLKEEDFNIISAFKILLKKDKS